MTFLDSFSLEKNCQMHEDLFEAVKVDIGRLRGERYGLVESVLDVSSGKLKSLKK